jgi:1-pyrroline-5-carboxylate dehydrogenase
LTSHFTGSTHLKISGQKLEQNTPLQNIPKIVGNWRKRFHHCSLSANPKQVGIVRGAFEFQGQNVQQLQDLCTKSLWPAIKEQIITDVKSMKMGSPEDFSNFITAVIHEGF